MKINIAGVINCEGARLGFEKEFALGDFEFAGSEYSFETPLKVSGFVENIGSALKIYISVEGVYKSFCDRCAAVIEKPLFAEVTEDITENREALDEEMLSLTGHILDISGAAETLVYTNLPIVNLCSEECKGLCPKCGIDLNKNVCNCDTTRYDPRFAIFRKLSENGEV